MSDRYIKSDENNEIFYIDANNSYGHSMKQSLSYDQITINKIVKSEDILNTPDGSDIGYFIVVDLKYPYNLKKEQNFFHLLLKIRKVMLTILVVI